MNVPLHLPLFSNLFVFQIESLTEIHIRISHKNKLFPHVFSQGFMLVMLTNRKMLGLKVKSVWAALHSSLLTKNNGTFFARATGWINKPTFFFYCCFFRPIWCNECCSYFSRKASLFWVGWEPDWLSFLLLTGCSPLINNTKPTLTSVTLLW